MWIVANLMWGSDIVRKYVNSMVATVELAFAPFLWLMVCGYIKCNVPGILHDICLTDTFIAECPEGQVIMMRQAQYGRMQINRCVDSVINCAQDVMPYMDDKCSGRNRCKVPGVENDLYALTTCPVAKPPYLGAIYDCIEVIHGNEYQQQCDSRNEVLIKERIGLLSSTHVYRRHNNNGPPCAYNIEATPGQVFNVTLVDLGIFEHEGSFSSCHQYAEIRESVSSQALSVCRGRMREKHVFTSRSNKIQIRFSQSEGEADESAFLLKYSVLGCSDPELRGNMLLERTHSKIELYCDSTGMKQTLMCTNNQWSEAVMSCSVRSSWNTGILVVLAIGILIGMIIGSCVFLSILYCIRKRRENQRRQNTDGYYTTYRNQPGTLPYPGHTLPRKSLPSDKQDYMTAGFDQQANMNATLRKPANHLYEPGR